MEFIILLHKELYNKKSKEQLKEKLESEAFNRVTCSFYKGINQIFVNNEFLSILQPLRCITSMISEY